LRKKKNIKVRQPLSTVLIPLINAKIDWRLKKVEDLIKSEVNVKNIEVKRGFNDIAKRTIKPNFRTLGKKFGGNVNAVVDLLKSFDEEKIKILMGSFFSNNVPIKDNNTGAEYIIAREDFEIITEDVPGWEFATEGDLTVALDITLTEDLKSEGNARELVNRIQNLRKDKDFNVTDRIKIRVEQNPLIISALNDFKNYICTEVLAEELTIEPQLTGADEVEVNENPVKLIIERKMN